MFGLERPVRRWLQSRRSREGAGAKDNGQGGGEARPVAPPEATDVVPPRVIPMREVEELCEIGWTLGEAGDLAPQSWQRIAGERKVAESLTDGSLDPWIRLGPEGFVLTEAGYDVGRAVVRRHRLAERLLTTVLDLKEEEAEESACEFEHILSPAVTDRICSFLGHPPVCPHGKPIPAGECCLRREKEVRPIVSRLVDIPIGAQRRITFINPNDPSLLSRLSTLGIVPGHLIRVKAHRPSYVIETGETVLALDKEVAAAIFVRDV